MSREKICLFILMLFFGLSSPLVGATYWVKNTNDQGKESLRQAISDAHTITPNTYDVIFFNIPGGGVQTIVPRSPLPALTDPKGTYIDGLSQPGASAGNNPPFTANLLIEVKGNYPGLQSNGFLIQSNNNTIRGLVINEFWFDGIRIEGTGPGIAQNNDIEFNFIGTDPTGLIDKGNGTVLSGFAAGVHITHLQGGIAKNNLVFRNLISGNYTEGVWIAGHDSELNFVDGNHIGTEIFGTMDLGNDHSGVALVDGPHDNVVINNLISGNDHHGVCITGLPAALLKTHHNIVTMNRIGLDFNWDESNPLPNSMHGVSIGEYGTAKWGFADYNEVKQNWIAFNLFNGVSVVEEGTNKTNADHNLISQNFIWRQGKLGIDLENNGVTPNDGSSDPDTGANEEQNYPLIITAIYNPATKSTTVDFILHTVNASAATVEVFKARIDPTTGYGEGELYLGNAQPGVGGIFQFITSSLNPGDYVTATATDTSNNTSEFCEVALVGGGALTANSKAISISNPQTHIVTFNLNAGTLKAGRTYLLLGTMSGTFPGTYDSVSGLTLPINWDVFTNFVYQYVNTTWFQNFFGTLNAQGTATATLDARTLPLPLAQLHFAYTLLNPADLVSNAWPIFIVP